jgi:hypothetical protein
LGIGLAIFIVNSSCCPDNHLSVCRCEKDAFCPMKQSQHQKSKIAAPGHSVEACNDSQAVTWVIVMIREGLPSTRPLSFEQPPGAVQRPASCFSPDIRGLIITDAGRIL